MLIDNFSSYSNLKGINAQTTGDTIQSLMGKDKGREGKLDLVTGFFTLHGLNFLEEVMADKTTFRLVLSRLAGDSDSKEPNCAIDLLSEDNGVEAMLQLSDDARRAVEFLKRDNVAIRAITNAFCHAKSYIFEDDKDSTFDSYITGSSNLTDAGLGLIPSHNVELNVAETGHTDTFEAHQKWFNALWDRIQANEMMPSNPNDPDSPKISVKEYFINLITTTILREYTPKDIYYKILYEYFKAAIEIDNPEIEKDIQLLQNTAIYKTLFDYQQKGAISVIQMLEKFNGAILADAVGLGKTFSALAVMWYFQNKGYSVVVFCPKKLQQNWEQYQEFAGSRFERDRFHFVVDFHTDLQGDRMQNKSHGSLSYLQSQTKLLVVIDESHNLRNEKSERYKMLINDIIAKNDDKRMVKVLQLSATPINNRLTDVRNQFNLIGHGHSNAFDQEFDIESLTSLFKEAQTRYSDWTKLANRTIGGLIQKLPNKFFTLTDRLIVARTRKMVEETTQSDLGFPKQKDPLNIYKGISQLGNYNSFDEIYQALLAANLTAYKPSMYMGNANAKNWQDDTYREASLVKMMATLFTKRLESSWFACLTTIERVLNVHKATLRKVDQYMTDGGIGTIHVELDDVIPDDDEEMDEIITSLDKGRVDLSQMRYIAEFREDLIADIHALSEFYQNICLFRDQFESGKVQDDKLEMLKAIICDKQKQKNKKLVIFTAFSDTADYLYQELAKDPALKAKMACVTGNRTMTPEGSTSKFGEVLQRFAPVSKLYKEKDWSALYLQMDDKFYASHYNIANDKWNVTFDEWKSILPTISPKDYSLLNSEIDILIATDCLSEGQNLQDADMVVNYDIHWNPVRLIQRFGRIDRIGSENEYIQGVNFWPADDYDAVLKLAQRINNRMVAMAVVGAETLEVNPDVKQMLDDNPLIDENTQKLLEQMKKNISDIEQPQTVTMANLSLETFRQDLLEFLKSQKDFFQNMPYGAYSGFQLAADAADIPASLVALVGYPHRKTNERDKKYEKLYLVCQPVEKGATTTIDEVNVAQVLDFLRKNKDKQTIIPEWIKTPSAERITKLKNIIKGWMEEKMREEGRESQRDKRDVVAERRAGIVHPTINEKFQIDNFDLIVWEYITK